MPETALGRFGRGLIDVWEIESLFQLWLKMSFTHQHGIIDLSLAWIHRQTEFSLFFFFIISLLSHSFHLVSRFFHFLFIIILWCSSSSKSSMFLFIIIGITRHRHWYSSSSSKALSLGFLFIFCLLFQPLFIHLHNLLVRCLQSEQNIHQKSHFSCAILKFAL